MRLLTRTTRSVTPTEAGERLLASAGPRLDEIDADLAALGDLRERPAGTIRINTSERAAETILWPALERLLPLYPDIKVELAVDQSLADIVAERCDAGVRLGEQVAKDMIAVRIGPDIRMAVVGSPASVGVTLRVVRVSSRTPSLVSNPRSVWLRAEGETPSRAAARVKLRSRATATKAARSSRPARGIDELTS